MLNWLDFAIVAIFALAMAVEIKRGFGRALFDFAALLLAVWGTSMLMGPLSGAIKLVAGPSANEAAIYAASFLIIGGVLLFVGKLVYDSTLISAEAFDPLFGGVCGVGIAIILSHVLVRSLALHAGLGAMPAAITDSVMAEEFLAFETYHRVVDMLYNFNRLSREQ